MVTLLETSEAASDVDNDTLSEVDRLSVVTDGKDIEAIGDGEVDPETNEAEESRIVVIKPCEPEAKTEPILDAETPVGAVVVCIEEVLLEALQTLSAPGKTVS